MADRMNVSRAQPQDADMKRQVLEKYSKEAKTQDDWRRIAVEYFGLWRSRANGTLADRQAEYEARCKVTENENKEPVSEGQKLMDIVEKARAGLDLAAELISLERYGEAFDLCKNSLNLYMNAPGGGNEGRFAYIVIPQYKGLMMEVAHGQKKKLKSEKKQRRAIAETDPKAAAELAKSIASRREIIIGVVESALEDCEAGIAKRKDMMQVVDMMMDISRMASVLPMKLIEKIAAIFGTIHPREFDNVRVIHYGTYRDIYSNKAAETYGYLAEGFLSAINYEELLKCADPKYAHGLLQPLINFVRLAMQIDRPNDICEYAIRTLNEMKEDVPRIGANIETVVAELSKIEGEAKARAEAKRIRDISEPPSEKKRPEAVDLSDPAAVARFFGGPGPGT